MKFNFTTTFCVGFFPAVSSARKHAHTSLHIEANSSSLHIKLITLTGSTREYINVTIARRAVSKHDCNTLGRLDTKC